MPRSKLLGHSSSLDGAGELEAEPGIDGDS